MWLMDMAHPFDKSYNIPMHVQVAGTYFAYLMSNSSPGTYMVLYLQVALFMICWQI